MSSAAAIQDQALAILREYEQAQAELQGKAVILTNGIAKVHLNKLHGLRVSIEGHAPMHVHELIETTTMTVGTESFYGDTFRDCRLILSPGGNPRFFNCVFLNCAFDPPYPASNAGACAADDMFGCVINP